MPASPFSMDEQMILERLRSGDSLVFEWLFTSRYPRLCFYATKLLGNTTLAEEIVSDTFADIWEKRERIVFTSSVTAYLFSMVHNKCINQIRRDKVITSYKRHLLQTKAEFSPADMPDQVFDEKALAEKINRAIESLPEKCQVIFRMSRFENRKYREIAEILQLSTKTVEKQMSIALDKIRRSLGNLMTILAIF